MKSIVKELGLVSFPEFLGERIYMVPFTKTSGLPVRFSRWQPTIDQMLVGVESVREIYLMVDQGEVGAGQAHRRPGPHIDGNWIASMGRHGGTGGHGKHRPGRWDNDGGNWGTSSEAFRPEAVILASSVYGCDGFVGEYEGQILAGGDCSGIDLSGLHRVQLAAGRAYAGNVTFVHESVPQPKPVQRTLVRLNVPGWEPK